MLKLPAREGDRPIGERSFRRALPTPDTSRELTDRATYPGTRARAAGCLLLALAVAACADGAEQPEPDVEVASPDPAPAADCTDPAIRELVSRFGASLREVSLLAPDTIVAAEMREAYADLVTPEVLADWTADPSTAPGRDVSSPWPQRIDIAGIDPDGADACVVRGEVVYVSSADTASAAAATRRGVTLTVAGAGAWRIGGYEAGEGAASGTATADTAAR